MPLETQPARSITWRSVLLGTLAAAAVCGLTPYNDFVLSDTSLVTGFLPLAAVLAQFFIIVAINAPLHVWAPKQALRTGELTVILLMILVACGIPNWGLMRFLIPTPVAPFRLGQADQAFWRAFVSMELPGWLFPVSDITTGREEDAVKWFYWSTARPIPWSAWIAPLTAWGIFAAAMFATLVAIARLVIDQWVTNERLPFPLVQVQLSLLEAPKRGRALNDLFLSPWLWIGLGSVFIFHSLNALNLYYPRYFPKIPLGYDFTGFITDRPVSGEPLSFLDNKAKKAALSFIVIGVTYFIRSKVAFSLWGIYLMVNIFNVAWGSSGGIEMPSAAWADQHLGACVAFVAGILWIGREHWKRVLRNAIGAGADSQYRLTFWIAVAGCTVMFGWLLVVGVGPLIAICIVLFIVTAHLVVSRVVAETGVPFYRSGIAVSQVYTNLPIGWFTHRDIYFSSVFTVLGPLTTRDSVMAFTTTGLAATKSAEVSEPEQRRGLGWVVAWTVLVGFLVAAPATLYCQYRYATPASEDIKPARNYFGAEYIPKRDVAPPNVYFGQGKYIGKQHTSWLHISVGFVITALLEFASLRWTAWPILPVGYVAYHGAFIGNAWFSIFVGWALKVMIVRFGGTSLFQKNRPFFIGIIFGEALAAAIWLVINGIIVFSGGEIKSIKILL